MAEGWHTNSRLAAGETHACARKRRNTSLTRAASPGNEESGESPAFAALLCPSCPEVGRSSPRPPDQTARRGGGSQAARPPDRPQAQPHLAPRTTQATTALADDDRRAISHTRGATGLSDRQNETSPSVWALSEPQRRTLPSFRQGVAGICPASHDPRDVGDRDGHRAAIRRRNQTQWPDSLSLDDTPWPPRP